MSPGKRILICGQHFSPELPGIAKYSTEMSAWLTNQGHEIRAIMPVPSYPEWEIAEGYRWWQYRKENISGVTVYRCPAWIPAKPNAIGRLLHMLSYALSSLPVFLLQITWRPKLVLLVEPPIILAPTVWITAKLSRAKSWIHIQDFEVEAAFGLQIVQGKTIQKLAIMMESFLITQFDLKSSISRNMLARIVKKGAKENSTYLFRNWVNTQEIKPLNSNTYFRKKLRIPSDHKVVLYSGNMGKKQGLEILLEVAHQLQPHNHIHLIIAGNGASKDELQRQAKNISNISWLDLQPQELLNELLNTADIHILPQKLDMGDLVLPSKLTGMLATARPVVTGALTNTELSEIVQQCGLVVEPENPTAYTEAILDLTNDDHLCKVLGQRGREIALKELDHESILNQFEQRLCKLIS